MADLVTAEDCFVPKPKEEEEETERTYKSYREIISTLPTIKAWCGMHFRYYQGFWFQPIFGLEGLMWMQQHFQARPTDVYLTSKPKSGTTRLKALVFSIMNRTRYSFSTHPLITTSPHECVPFLEHLFRSTPIADPEIMTSPRLFSTHTPYSLLPETMKSCGCRIVYVCREPKDVLVSLWHYMNRIWAKDLSKTSLEEAFNLFCDGVSPCGPYWDHVLEYWKASLEWPKRVLFLKYEDLKKEPLVNVRRLAEFLSQPFSSEEEEAGVVQEIVKLCCFESMSNLEMTKSRINRVDDLEIKNDVYFRQGKVGDWRNHLTAEMIEHIDQIMMDQKFKGYGLTF